MVKDFFTLEQAHEALRFVGPVVADIVTKITALEKANQLPPMDNDELRQNEMKKMFAELEYHWKEVVLTGAQLKDARIGLIDFPSTYQGRPILLCWMLGESDIHFWHEQDQGFSSRKKIDESFVMTLR